MSMASCSPRATRTGACVQAGEAGRAAGAIDGTGHTVTAGSNFAHFGRSTHQGVDVHTARALQRDRAHAIAGNDGNALLLAGGAAGEDLQGRGKTELRVRWCPSPALPVCCSEAKSNIKGKQRAEDECSTHLAALGCQGGGLRCSRSSSTTLRGHLARQHHGVIDECGSVSKFRIDDNLCWAPAIP